MSDTFRGIAIISRPMDSDKKREYLDALRKANPEWTFTDKGGDTFEASYEAEGDGVTAIEIPLEFFLGVLTYY